ncbi:NAD-glutamate dehydrogenase [Propionicimonas sp.]|uniref:NAD-glutamate dehydrogenase n=1 Tax=Propionicimonas sp. TaxID=1955623 RepID=UPI001D4100B2|nr:NAD-glutamate dehydrogenase [Propionicimonas sp.]MBU3977543.1 NAD-glutamate dehydrogenase [Actinomycetota bacterium]MBU3987017.1 NAD-glutamate dehydrogenase [Actinomycetota bacterium]MBU4008838.1 NAD-glutamate dehydrogenase [Actinomycetota bacterium]MBU4066012.1 NAD-glutamate dehydrogenase [Actinomycetota bacterium]MBU4093460.1 NAD-glutamate dehydrogenase [Actinomycetota bacterium]
MSTLASRALTGLREALLTQATKNASPPQSELIRQYVAQIADSELEDLDPAALAATAAAHLDLGATRKPGESLLRIFTPQEWDARGSTVVLLITDDQPFLVDTAVMELTSKDWSLRGLYHPTPAVGRDADGRLRTVGAEAGDDELHEAWLVLEVYPPLGHAAAELSAELAAGLKHALAMVAVTVADWQPMLARCRQAAEEQRHEPSQEAGETVELLDWLADGHFVFVGYSYFTGDTAALTPADGSQLGILRGETEVDRVNLPAPGERDPLVLVRDRRRSPVHRPAYLTHLAIRRYAEDGSLIGEHRFLGLLAAGAYTESLSSVPILAPKTAKLLAMSGFEPNSFGWNALRQVIASYPRDELFEASAEELSPIIGAIAGLRERRQVRVFLRHSRFGGFVTALVFLPRDRYDTATRVRIQQILLDGLGGVEVEYRTLVSESVLTRLFFVIRLGAEAPQSPDLDAIIAATSAAALSWEDEFAERAATLPSEQRGVEFDHAYEADYTPAVALADLIQANRLSGDEDLRLVMTAVTNPEDPADLRLKVFTKKEMSLAKVMPHLSVLGAEVLDENPYRWELRGERVQVYDFGLRIPDGASWDPAARQRFADAFEASWSRRCEPGSLNKLVVPAGLRWQQVTYLRGILRYLQQAGVPFSQVYMAGALNANPEIAAELVAAFETKFDPQAFGDAESRATALAEVYARLEVHLDAVASLDHDRILRAMGTVIRACVRTNAFSGNEVLAFKLRPEELDLLPQPRPAYEIFVYSPRVQGVHLRFGLVARGGLRWSDRLEDFRTEVLGLVKAQMVKNTVIVPVGAKGGFVPLRLPPVSDRAARAAEGQACYKLFVDALLSVTDNIVDGQVKPPEQVLRYDGDDPYLVVAADKGTATFSDLANEISVRRGFWLGDAFASGGSSGYDHKAMGITARGAWESVKRHFAEMGLDPAVDEFTCVGIGDMAGDVFGNGMLCSDKIKLVAAFNHVHIFLDPDPDAAASFAERRRLFTTPGSTWADYQGISEGGGVYGRDAKSIPLSPQVRQALGLPATTDHLPPNELITAILTAPVDLVFNGGVGTYVKAFAETHAAVGDKANDALRVDGVQLRARCVAEGGNLGCTQLGRIEYARAGGRINTDFIDNSAGVDTSDHEVNIKILLADRVAGGYLSLAERDELLASMTDEVAQLVLAHNLDQNLALSNSELRSERLMGQLESWMSTLVSAGLLDRGLESLPSSEEMTARIASGAMLTRPELSTLLAYTKIALKKWVLATDLPEDPYLADRLMQYFPEPLRERFAEQIPGHRLGREIITTVAVNRFVNSQGITAYHRLATETGAGVADIIRAQLAARAIFNVGLDEVRLRRSELPADLATELRVTLLRMVERGTRWLLHHGRTPLDVAAAVAAYAPGIAELRPLLASLLAGADAHAQVAHAHAWIEGGVGLELAENLSTAGQAHTLLSVVQVAHRLGLPALQVAEVHYRLADALGLDLLFGGVDGLPRQVRWDAMARAALRDELLSAHAELTAKVLASASPSPRASAVVASWVSANPSVAARVATIRQVCDGAPDVARMNVGLSQLRAMLSE